MTWKRASGFALARFAVGLVFLFDGMEKLGSGEPFPGVPAALLGISPPGVFLSVLGTVIPFLELALGALLLAGLLTTPVLVPTGALLVVLTFGTVLGAGNSTVLAQEIAPMVGAGLLLWVEAANDWTASRLRIREEMGAPPPRLDLMPPLPREHSRRWSSRPPPRYRVVSRSAWPDGS
jgi:uncharacterized membrane protein YphA (DoxX/SURF4 family)